MLRADRELTVIGAEVLKETHQVFHLVHVGHDVTQRGYQAIPLPGHVRGEHLPRLG